jgi:prepilin-type N-terminal cleavage/methylation domain-containing protein
MKSIFLKTKNAFTLIELIFVIVIIGMLSSFGVSIISKAYETYIFSTTQNRLQAQSQQALDVISKRLEFRLRPSIIARDALVDNPNFATNFVALASSDGSHETLEWIDTFPELMTMEHNVSATVRVPLWSGFIDVEDSNITEISLPRAGTNEIEPLINHLSNGLTDFNDTAMFFLGSQSDVSDYGWDGTGVGGGGVDTTVTHRLIMTADFDTVDFDDGINGSDIYESGKMAWTAYAIELNATNHLNLYYDYQPWEGATYITNGTRVLISENVSTFKFQGVGDVIKLQVCISDNNIFNNAGGGFSICKEKTVY